MIVRSALLLLVLLLAATLFGRWQKSRVGGRPPATPIEAARRCPDCDAYVFGPRPEPCDRADCRFRAA